MSDTPTVVLVSGAGERADEGARPGTTIGKYVIRSRIGSGGCGTVYAAYDPILERDVALKLLVRGAAAEGATVDPGWPRLVREARMLAKLSEPQVVTVYDVGDADGQAFLAMEMIDGVDLQQWIDAHRRPDAPEPLPLRAALDLLEQAGRGLAVAHESGVVHGDFKPANVLIDRRGRAKVSDFGIARLAEASGEPELASVRGQASHVHTDGGSDAPRTATISGNRPLVGTPAYMAPEQFEGHPANVQSDVYAFCATLYQVVFGVLPYRGVTVAELAARKAAGNLAFPSKPRVPTWLTRLLTRGLAVERERRFATMAEVLDELARARSRASRRWFTLGGALAGAALVAGLFALPRDSGRCRDLDAGGFPWNATAAADVRAAFAAAEASASTTDYVVERLDAFTAGWRSAYAEACAAAWSDPKLADQAFGCLRRRRAIADALVQAWRAPTRELVDAAPAAVEALPSTEACVDPEALAGQPDLPEDPTLRERVVEMRARIEAAVVARTTSADEGLARAREAYEEAQQLGYAPLQAQAALALGQAFESGGDFEQAQEKLREAFFAAQRVDDHETAAAAAATLVYLVGTRLEEHEQGLLWVEHARVAYAKTGGNTAPLMSNEAALFDRLARHEDAIARYRESLAEHDPEDLYGLGITNLRLADALRTSKQFDAALTHYDRAMELWRSVLGEDHPRLSVPAIGRATVLAEQGRDDEAIAGFRSALDGVRRAFGPDHPNVGALLVNLGITLEHAGDVEEAEASMREALRITIAAYGENHLKVAQRREVLGRLLTATGRTAEALAEHERSAKTFAEGLPEEHPDRIVVQTNIGDAHRAAGDLERALEAYRGAVASARLRAEDDPWIGDALAYLGRALVEAERFDEARPILRESLDRLERAEGWDDARAIARDALAKLP